VTSHTAHCANPLVPTRMTSPVAVDWRLLAAVEKQGKAQGGGRYARLTLSDAILARPGFEGTADTMRAQLLHALQAANGFMEPGANGEV